jgi:hypothetical protein
MSLYLPDQKLGSRSQPGSSSHKFVVKGRQTGSMHRGHTWVFRAETYETMLAWYDDIKSLTEKTGEERNAFVRRHASVRSTSAGSARSASSDGGLEEDEADAVPYSANQSLVHQPVREQISRPSPGGRFPSDLNVQRSLQAPLSPSSGSSDFGDHDITTAAGGPQQHARPMYAARSTGYQEAEPIQPVQHRQEYPAAEYVNAYPPTQQTASYAEPPPQSYPTQQTHTTQHPTVTTYSSIPQQYAPQPVDPTYASINRPDSTYGGWLAPAAGGAAVGALGGHIGTEAYHRNEIEEKERAQQEEINNQAQQHNQDRSYAPQPLATTGYVGAPPAVPARDPDHHAPATIDEYRQTSAPGIHPTLIPAPIIAAGATREPTHSHVDDAAATTPSNASFLDESEVGAAPFGATSGNTINGGPVPVGLVEVAEARAHPGMHRTNTDISVSDLHVPGEYPRAQDAKVSPALKEEDLIQM